eukprot:gene5981-7189_t
MPKKQLLHCGQIKRLVKVMVVVKDMMVVVKDMMEITMAKRKIQKSLGFPTGNMSFGEVAPYQDYTT